MGSGVQVTPPIPVGRDSRASSLTHAAAAHTPSVAFGDTFPTSQRRRRSPFDRLEAAAIDPELQELVVAIVSDDERQGLLKVGTSRRGLALIKDRARHDRDYDRGLAVVGKFSVLEAGLPGDELAFDKGVMLVEAIRKLLQNALRTPVGSSVSGWSATRSTGKFRSGLFALMSPSPRLLAFAIDRTA
jgi:hypothetical protein